MYIVAGLGNPGPKYMYTRHNVGYDVIDLLARNNNIAINTGKFKGVVGSGLISGQKVLLLKPVTYMNLSGISVLDAVQYYRIDLNNLMVVYDDIDLELGSIRIKPKGSAGSHNGMKSVLYQLQTEEFPRLRVGIGRPPDGQDMAYYVLDRFSKQDREIVDRAIEKAAAAIEAYLEKGIDHAMCMYNG